MKLRYWVISPTPSHPTSIHPLNNPPSSFPFHLFQALVGWSTWGTGASLSWLTASSSPHPSHPPSLPPSSFPFRLFQTLAGWSTWGTGAFLRWLTTPTSTHPFPPTHLLCLSAFLRIWWAGQPGVLGHLCGGRPLPQPLPLRPLPRGACLGCVSGCEPGAGGGWRVPKGPNQSRRCLRLYITHPRPEGFSLVVKVP